MLDDVLHIHSQTPLNIFPDGRAFRWRMVLRRPRPPGRAMSTGDMVVGPAPRDKGGPAPGPQSYDVAGSGSGLGRRPEPTRPGVWRGGVYADGELSPKRGL
ncbi:MAG: hypothetical protein QXF95_01155 [Candidatus Caldarchaeum sp.]